MAMVVQHNISAQLALGELNKNSSKLGKLLGKVSSGQKINSAQDDASGYVISEKMREMVRTLNQDHQNVQNGSSLMKIAEGGINSIVEELRNLKELAINAANDTNTDVDRLTIQKVFYQKKLNINDIATETNYNTIRLLDGSLGNSATTSYWIGGDDDDDDGGGLIGNVYEPTNFIGEISGNYTINSDGVYRLTGSANITINAKNVKIVQDDPDTEISDVYMTGPSGGGANLWIENFNISDSQARNFIKFQGKNNYLNFKGTNTISAGGSNNAVIHIGGGLTVAGGNDGSGVFTVERGPSWGAAIGTDANEASKANIIINSGTYINGESYNRTAAAFIGSSGVNGGVGNIIIHGGKFQDDNYNTMVHDAFIGTGSNSGNIYIENATIVAEHMKEAPVIGCSNNDSKVGNITVKNSSITYKGTTASAVGTLGWSSGNRTSCGNITIDSCKLDIEITGGGAGIGTGVDGTVDGVIKIINTDLSNVRVSGGGEVVGRGVGGTVTGRERDDDEDFGDGSSRRRVVVYGVDAPLMIHHGPKANQATKFYINDMHTKSLGTGRLIAGKLPTNDEDLARYDALSYDEDLQKAWLETLEAAQNKNLDDVDVITKKNANVAIRVIDGAIDYALNEATRIGAYMQRLDYTDANLVVMNENVQAAESSIRDADMAKEMTEYTKMNVLAQASQAMLAQANQNGAQVLSLLQ